LTTRVIHWWVLFLQGYRGITISNSPVYCEDFRETIINDVTKTIEDEKFRQNSRSEDGGNGFSRNRKITFIHLIVLLTQGLARSLQRELNSFYQKLQQSDFSLQYVTKGAFSRARAKLNPWAFKELNRVCNQSFYDNAPFKTWRGLRLLAIDGSTAVLPSHHSIKDQFGIVNYGPYADSPQSIARLSMLYDVLNLTTLDGQMGSYETSERELVDRHLKEFKPLPVDLLLFDRGYPSLSLMYNLHAQGLNYCIRMRADWWLEVRKMLAAGESDKIVIFELPKKNRKGVAPQADGSYKIKCRLVAVLLPNGTQEVLCTSICDETVLPYDCFVELYHFRWNIEEGYKLIKSRIEIEAFSGKTAIAVQQDFFARILMMTLSATLAFPIDEKLRAENQNSDRKYANKVNRTNALAMTKEVVSSFFIKKIVQPAIIAMDKILESTTEIIRPNRTNPRKKIQKKPPSMNYKQL
jgi:hypothetical protein